MILCSSYNLIIFDWWTVAVDKSTAIVESVVVAVVVSTLITCDTGGAKTEVDCLVDGARDGASLDGEGAELGVIEALG